ncbi:MAG: hypothetical protein ABIK45_14155 [Pseudomonadota bacterium]
MTGIAVYQFLDPWLIWAFRIGDNPHLGFAVGIFWLCLLTTVIGELCMAGVYFLNKKHFATINQSMVRHHNLSLQALGAKDKTAWKACNSIANDAFGKNFFSRIALFASSLWVVPFAIGWLSFRFSSVDFVLPYLGEVGVSFLFIPLYIVTRVLFCRAKPVLPVFRHIKRKVAENEGAEILMSYSDLAKKEDGPAVTGPVPGNS